MDGLRQLLERAGAEAADVGYLAHGSTVATNAIVQRRLARTALITNEGFRDVLAIGTQMRARVYDLWTHSRVTPRKAAGAEQHGSAHDIGRSQLAHAERPRRRRRVARPRRRGRGRDAAVLFINDEHERLVGDPGGGATGHRRVAVVAGGARVPRVRARTTTALMPCCCR